MIVIAVSGNNQNVLRAIFCVFFFADVEFHFFFFEFWFDQAACSAVDKRIVVTVIGQHFTHATGTPTLSINFHDLSIKPYSKAQALKNTKHPILLLL